MTKDFWLGFLSCLCLILIIGPTPTKATSPLYIKENEEVNIYDAIQKPSFMIVTSTPIASSIRGGQGYWFSSGGVWWQTKIGTDTYKVLMTKV